MIQTEDREGVRTITLNRPPSNNLNAALLNGLKEAARAAAGEPSVRAVLLRSALPKYFSAGLDPEELSNGGSPTFELFQTLFSTYRAWLELPKPTVAAVEGYALLGGCIVAMTCDFRFIAQETGRMALSEIRMGLSPMPLLLSRLFSIGVSPAAARQLALKGRTLRGDEALAAGLVDRAIPGAQLMEEAWSEAKALTRLPPLAYGAVKRHLARAGGPDFETLWNESMAEFPKLVASPEAKQAVAAIATRGKKGEAREQRPTAGGR